MDDSAIVPEEVDFLDSRDVVHAQSLQGVLQVAQTGQRANGVFRHS